MSEIISIITGILGLVGGFVTIFITIRTQIKRNIENLRKRYDHFNKILDDYTKGKTVQAFTGLKDYIGTSIDDKTADYILKSNQFYEITGLYRSAKTYLIFDPLKKIFKIKGNKKKIKLWDAYIQFSIFITPLFLYICSLTEMIKYHLSISTLISLGIITLPFTMASIISILEIRNRTNAIELLKKTQPSLKIENQKPVKQKH